MMDRRVLLPAPLGPAKSVMVPALKSRSTPRSAGVAPKRRVTPRTRTALDRSLRTSCAIPWSDDERLSLLVTAPGIPWAALAPRFSNQAAPTAQADTCPPTLLGHPVRAFWRLGWPHRGCRVDRRRWALNAS